MTIAEMTVWLSEAEGGEQPGAVLASFLLCLEDPEAVEHLTRWLEPIEPTDFALLHFALGHYLAVQGIDVLARKRERLAGGKYTTISLDRK